LRPGLIIAGILTAVTAAHTTEDAVPPYLFTAAPRYDSAAWEQGRERFPQGASVIFVSGAARRRMAPSFYASADPVVSYDGARVLFAGKPTATSRWQIWEMAAAGGAPSQLTRDSTDCIDPLYMPDGRIAYTRLAPAGSEILIAAPTGGNPQRLTFAPGWRLTNDVLRDGRILFESQGDLFTVYPDGTGVESLRCDHGPRRAAGRQITSGDVVFTAAGKLARFTTALATQADVAQPTLEPTGPIAEIAPGKWLISLRKPGGPFALYQWEPDARRLSPLEIPTGSNAIQPAIVRPRVAPKQFPSGLVDTRKTGNLLCLDARASKAPITEVIAAVQVYTHDDAGAQVLLGRADVAGDGSFYVEVPSDRPLRIELLNGSGHTVRAERDWFWMRPSEQRICVGCHTGPERSPENKVPEILLRTIVPEKLLGKTQ